MYAYDELDRTLINERVSEFRDQVKRRLSGELTEDEFKMLRLQNGVYLQLHAYMFRVAIPYGTLSSKQLRALAHVARRYDRGYGHFTTRQNIQFNWIKLAELPDALADLAEVGIHAMQTSGNNTRNVTSDQWAGVAPGEIEDPRIWSELLRQYTTLHPEFSFLPRKFKFAITASAHDRAAIKVHDIGLRLHKNADGETGFEVLVGGGLGRTPFIGKTIKQFVPGHDLLSYVEAILRVYNQYGRRDNIYKARIKILVHELGIEKFAKEVEEEWQQIRDGALALETSDDRGGPFALQLSGLRKAAAHAGRIEEGRARPAVRALAQELGVPAQGAGLCHRDAVAEADRRRRPATPPPSRWTRLPISPTNIRSAKFASATSRIWRCRMSRGAICRRCGRRSTRSASRPRTSIWSSDIIACPGLDYCSLANARSIPIAQELTRRFANHDTAEPDRPAAHQYLRLHQCLRPSPCRPHRHSRRREER